MRLLSRGDVIAPCKSSDDEESFSAPSLAPAPAAAKLHSVRLKQEEDAGSQQQEAKSRASRGGIAGSVRATYRFMKTNAEERHAALAPVATTGLHSSRDKPKSSSRLIGEQDQQQQLLLLRDSSSSAKPATGVARKPATTAAASPPAINPRPLVKKRAVPVATSPTHALATPSTPAAKASLSSPRSSPGSVAARLGLQSPENEPRVRNAPAAHRLMDDCASPRLVRRANLGSAKSKSGELGLSKGIRSGELGLSRPQQQQQHEGRNKSGELGLSRPPQQQHEGRNKSGELGLSRPQQQQQHEGRNKSGEIGSGNAADPATGGSSGSGSDTTSAASPRSPPVRNQSKGKVEQSTRGGAQQQDSSDAPPLPPLPPAAARAAPMVEAINLQDLEAGRVTDFDAASYDFAPGQAVQPEGKQHQFWLTPGSDTEDECEAFDPFCIPTSCAAGGVPATPTKPHKANDPNWEAVRTTRSRDGVVGLSHFRLLKRLGCGDIGSVYLAELRGTSCYFAMKVMDKGTLDNGKKQERAQTEREILELLDHPFLPTLYAHFDTPQFTCLVMEFCPGGDLHSLRQAQSAKCFTNSAARFYAAEVLLALEYLHMMGVVYRDLKPENVLVRKDGHIMLSDFDLSLKCDVSPTLLQTTSSSSSLSSSCPSPVKRHSLSSYNHHVRNFASCIMPACRIPSCTLLTPPCISGLPSTSSRASLARRNSLSSTCSTSSSLQASLHSLSGSFRRKHLRRESFGSQVVPLPELVAEPTDARSMSFVGTHEYLAPEIISGDGHGSAVDWWTFGIFLYELLYGKTPFRGADNQATLRNVLTQGLRFPQEPPGFDEEGEDGVSTGATSLIRGLLTKDPQRRLGSARGAAEIKAHPFFDCVNWALIRCATPPEVPKAFRPPDSVATVGGRTPPPSPVTDRDPVQAGPDSDVDFGDFF